MVNHETESPITVQSLIGAKEISFYSKCIRSLVNYCEDKINLVLHATESLSLEDKDCIYKSIEDSLIKLTYTQSNQEKVLDYLQNYPNCQDFRKNSIWGVEFFDPIFEKVDEQFSFYIDADILFIKSFRGLFNKNSVKDGAIFLKDTQWDSYSLRPWHLLFFNKRLKIVKGITTALVCWDKSVIDWDFLEWFLGQVKFHKIPEWIMPTAQAAMAAQCDAKTVHPSQVINMYPNADIKDNTLGLHLLGSYREKWLSKLGNLNFRKEYDTSLIQFQECSNQSPIGYGIRQAKRWINTRLDLW
jgi:hypothetical protein